MKRFFEDDFGTLVLIDFRKLEKVSIINLKIIFEFESTEKGEKGIALFFSKEENFEKATNVCREAFRACETFHERTLRESCEEVQVGIDRLLQNGVV